MSVTVDKVLAFTQEMMLAVIDEQWDTLLEMQSQQDQMFKQLFEPEPPEFTEQERRDLLEIQRLNQDIQLAADQYKSELSEELRSLKKGKAKVSAYQSL